MSQNVYIGMTLKPWPILLDHYTFESKIALDRVFASMLDDYGISKGMPHGFFKIEKSIISFQWSSSDIVETMLAKVGGEGFVS
ncbi:hypothetical protein GCM10009124_28770 [Shewanella xiamenensis]|nr:hypothetical protein GCM10009124_28770 [Shewanella xiamenensis]